MKYMRHTVDQLKCASNFTKQVTSARGGAPSCNSVFCHIFMWLNKADKYLLILILNISEFFRSWKIHYQRFTHKLLSLV